MSNPVEPVDNFGLLDRPLQAHEQYIKIRIETTELMLTLSDAQVRVSVLRKSWEIASEGGYIVTHGPAISEVHRPAFPGDAAWMEAVAVARS